MKMCAECRHWTRGVDSFGNHFPSHGECDNDKFVRGYARFGPLAHDAVLVENDEGWAFITGPDFGCVHFAPKPTMEQTP
jgi:hypothetical protein